IFLYGGVTHWDAGNKQLSVRFIPFWCRSNPIACNPLQEDGLFFRDMDALAVGGFNKSRAILDFQAPPINLSHFHWNQYLDLQLTQHCWRDVNELDFNYPQDWYELRVHLAAVSKDLNTTLPIIAADLVNFVDKFWAYTVETLYIRQEGQQPKISIRIVMHRSSYTKFLVFVNLVVNWTITWCAGYVTTTNIANRRRRSPGLDQLAILFGALFAMPSVRELMPGSPPFGVQFLSCWLHSQ
ncbi:hypothetical protein BKA62DRAFT_629902, partial [Auriculariales sp. MPI-PUGE-AT-0066]